jgi:hypothetical protein
MAFKIPIVRFARWHTPLAEIALRMFRRRSVFLRR